MEDFIDLPPHVGALSELPNEPFSISRMNSKRHLTDEDLARSRELSSDPALFSSDEPAASAETYASKRQKRFWKGTWWGERVDNEERNGKRAKFTRNFDSGVFLSSDSTESDLEEAFLDDQNSKPSTLPNVALRNNPLKPEQSDLRANSGPPTRMSISSGATYRPSHLLSTSVTQRSQQHRYTTNSQGQQLAENLVNQCVQDGNEVVDLSSLQLADLPSHTLLQLKTLTKTNAMQEMPSSSQDQAFDSLVPSIKLFLSNNRFKRLAADVFQLENLVVLSVRQNEIKKLPDAFRRLKRLEELNVSGNQLESLPHSILYLITRAKLKKLSAFPNPFKDHECGDKNSQFQSAAVNTPALVAESWPIYYWKNGRLANSKEITRQFPQLDQSWRSAQHGGIARSPSTPTDHVASLAELALLECSRHEELFDHVRNDDFEDPGMINAENKFNTTTGNPFGGSWHTSEPLADMLRLSHKVWLEGGKNCSVCGREFIIQRAAWCEWYQLSNSVTQSSSQDAENTSLSSNVIPFHREACSLSCYLCRVTMRYD